jgi:hypothetical protein
MRKRNYIREEVARLPWPEIIDDRAGDLEREIERLRTGRTLWRLVSLALLGHYALHLLGWAD